MSCFIELCTQSQTAPQSGSPTSFSCGSPLGQRPTGGSLSPKGIGVDEFNHFTSRANERATRWQIWWRAVENQFPSVQSFLAIPDAPVITWGHKVYNTQCIPGSSHELYKKPGALRNRSMVVVELEPLGLPAISWELPALEMASRHQIQVLRVVRRPNISVVAALTPQNISKPSK